MIKVLALFVLISACFIIITTNAQSSATNRDQHNGHIFDEIVVSSHLNVRRKSKENRQGKQLLLIPMASVPSKSPRRPPEPSTGLASKLVLSDGSSVLPEARKKRAADTARRRYQDLDAMRRSLRSRHLLIKN